MKKEVLGLLRGIDDAIFDNIGPIRLLFVIRNNIGYGCLIPLIRKTIEDGHFKVAVTLEHDGCFDFPNDEESQIIKRKFFITTKRALYKKWHYALFTDRTNLYFRRHVTMVCTSHGVGFGNLDSIGNSQDYWTRMAQAVNMSLIFCNSEASREVLPNDSANKDRCYLVTGMAKTDGIVNSKLDGIERKKTNECLKLRQGFKNVVIFSHWTEKSLLANFNAGDIERFCLKFPEYNFIIMGHQLLWKSHDGSDRKNRLFDELKKLEQTHMNFSFVPGLSKTTGLLKIADFFIGDHSSFYIEACLTNKPIYFYDQPDFKFLMPEVGARFKNCAINFSSPSELIKKFSQNKDEPDSYEDNRKEVVDYFLYQLNFATNYIVKSLKEMGRSSGPESKSWNQVKSYCEVERKKDREEQLRV
ncbi:MAG: hypothetical protein COB26_02870 [Piscirickettsiaceae bacterium]|nr:MAG: hypothetical protein COB26_02870 [Piscirickettsiaceae bacterium]